MAGSMHTVQRNSRGVEAGLIGRKSPCPKGTPEDDDDRLTVDLHVFGMHEPNSSEAYRQTATKLAPGSLHCSL